MARESTTFTVAHRPLVANLQPQSPVRSERPRHVCVLSRCSHSDPPEGNRSRQGRLKASALSRRSRQGARSDSGARLSPAAGLPRRLMGASGLATATVISHRQRPDCATRPSRDDPSGRPLARTRRIPRPATVHAAYARQRRDIQQNLDPTTRTSLERQEQPHAKTGERTPSRDPIEQPMPRTTASSPPCPFANRKRSMTCAPARRRTAPGRTSGRPPPRSRRAGDGPSAAPRPHALLRIGHLLKLCHKSNCLHKRFHFF